MTPLTLACLVAHRVAAPLGRRVWRIRAVHVPRRTPVHYPCTCGTRDSRSLHMRWSLSGPRGTRFKRGPLRIKPQKRITHTQLASCHLSGGSGPSPRPSRRPSWRWLRPRGDESLPLLAAPRPLPDDLLGSCLCCSASGRQRVTSLLQVCCLLTPRAGSTAARHPLPSRRARRRRRALARRVPLSRRSQVQVAISWQ